MVLGKEADLCKPSFGGGAGVFGVAGWGTAIERGGGDAALLCPLLSSSALSSACAGHASIVGPFLNLTANMPIHAGR